MYNAKQFDSLLRDGYNLALNNQFNKAISTIKIAFDNANTIQQKSYSSQVLGEIYLMKHDWKKSAHWLTISIGYDNTKALCKMGWLHYHDYLNESLFHKELAHDYFIRATRVGYGEGYYGLYLLEKDPNMLSECMKNGYNPPKSGKTYISPLDEKVESIEKSDPDTPYKSKNRNSKSTDMVDLDTLYDESKTGNSKAFKRMIDLASNGDADACHYVGLFLEETAQNPESIDLAIKWFDKGASLGNKSSERKKRILSGYSRNREDICPRCQVGLVIRPAPNGGYFKGCPNYPRCKYTTPVSTPIYNGRRQVTEWDCFRTYMKKK